VMPISAGRISALTPAVEDRPAIGRD